MLRYGGILDSSAGRRSARTSRLSLFLAIGVAALVGYGFGGSASEEFTKKAVQDAAANARQELAAAVCVEAFMQQPDAPERLAKLFETEWAKRSELLAKGGWATMPDRSQPDGAEAMRCAIRLGEVYASVRKDAPISALAK